MSSSSLSVSGGRKILRDPEQDLAFPGGFDTYGIAMHFVLPRTERVAWNNQDKSDHHFRSFERDLLSHVYRDDPGFRCRVLELPVKYQCVTLHLPKQLNYVAESTVRSLEQSPASLDPGGPERTRTLSMKASLTEFRSGVAILHVVFNPTVEYPASPSPDAGQANATSGKAKLSEYDVIKLSKFWEGGESVGKGEDHDLHQKVKFSVAGEKPITLSSLVEQALQGSKIVRREHLKGLSPNAGTIEIVIGDRCADVFDVMVEFESKNQARMEAAHQQIKPTTMQKGVHTTLERQLVYIQGFLCGLLDFNIDADEFDDVFANPISAKKSLFHDIHKGTLLKFITEDRAFESAYGAIGINPYLLYPQAVLLHNEELLASATSAAILVDRPNSEHNLRAAELALRRVLQRDLLPNVFHYISERKLHDKGHESRGLMNLRDSLEQRLKEINGRLDEVVSRKGAFLNICLALFGVMLAVGQLVSGWDALGRLVATWLRNSDEHMVTAMVGVYFVPAFIVLVPLVVLLMFFISRQRRG